MKRTAWWPLLALLFFCSSCHKLPAVKMVDFTACQSATARVNFNMRGTEAQATAFLAHCQNGDWRLLVKGDWSATLLDISQHNNRFNYRQRPAGLPKKELQSLSRELSAALQNQLRDTVSLQTTSVNMEMAVLSQRQLTPEQAQKLFMEP